jgi:DNA excision repair protein ERCC-4
MENFRENSPQTPQNPLPEGGRKKSETPIPNPQIVVDSREQTPLRFTRLPSVEGTLRTGDYSLTGFESHFAIERKSLEDLVGSLSRERERFMHEIDRLRGYDFCRLLVIGGESDVHVRAYRSRMDPKAVIASLAAIEARGVPLVWARTPAMAAEMVERWAVYFFRERMKGLFPASHLKALAATYWTSDSATPAPCAESTP